MVVVLLSILLLCVALLTPDVAVAHTPHVDVACIRFLDLPDGVRLLFAIVRENLWVSARGEPWRRLSRGLPFARCRDLAIGGRHLALATDAGLYHSQDCGNNWHRARYVPGYFPEPDALPLADATDPHLILAAEQSGSGMLCITPSGLLRSGDGGASWNEWDCGQAWPTAAIARGGGWTLGFSDGTVVALGPRDVETARWSTGARITSFSEDARNATLYAATDGAGVWRLPAESEAKPLGPTDKSITSLARIPADAAHPSGRLAAAAWREGVYILSGSDSDWTLHNRGLTREAQADHPSFLAPQFRQLLAEPGALLLAGFDGLFRSEDGGHRWHKLETGVTARTVVGVAQAGAGRVALSMYGAGAEIIDRALGAGQTIRTLRGLRTFALAQVRMTEGTDEVWVAAHDRVHVLDRRGTVIRTAPLLGAASVRAPRGAALRGRLVPHVKRFVDTLPVVLRNLLRAFVVRRGGLGGLRIWFPAFGSQFAVPSDFGDKGVAFLATFRDGLFVTRDFGRRFRCTGLGGAGILHDIALAEEPGGGYMIFAATDIGIRMSRDAGNTWQTLAADNSPVIRVAATYGKDGIVAFAATWAALYRGVKTSRAADWKWHPVFDGLDGHPVTEIAPAPDFARTGTVILNIAGRGLFRSTDGGTTFVACLAAKTDGAEDFPEAGQLPAFPDSAHTIAFDADFAMSGLIWAAAGTVVRESRDRGRTWTRIT